MLHITCSGCGATWDYDSKFTHVCPMRPWDMSKVNRVNIPQSEGALGVVLCPTEGCGAMLEANGPCYRCGWTLIVTRKEKEPENVAAKDC